MGIFMRRLSSVISILLVFTLIFAISVSAHDLNGTGFWNDATSWIKMDCSQSERIISAKYRYVYYNYNKSVDPCLGIQVNLNDKTKLSRSSYLNTAIEVIIRNSSGIVVDEFYVKTKQENYTFKGANGTFTAICEAVNANNGSNFRFSVLYNNLSNYVKNDELNVSLYAYASDMMPVTPDNNGEKFTVPRLSYEEPSTQKKTQTKNPSAKKSKSKKSTTKSSSKKRYSYSSTTAHKYSKGYKGYSYKGTGKVSTTKSEKSADFETEENYNKADIVSVPEEKSKQLNTKQITAIIIICIAAGCATAAVIIFINNKTKKKASDEDEIQ